MTKGLLEGFVVEENEGDRWKQRCAELERELREMHENLESARRNISIAAQSFGNLRKQLAPLRCFTWDLWRDGCRRGPIGRKRGKRRTP